MRVMVIVKASERSEAGEMPTAEELNAMGRFNTELVNAGIMLAGDGLRPSKDGVRITYEGGGTASATDGPFAETKELVAGFWILEVRSLDEAVEWMRRAPIARGTRSRSGRSSRPRTSARSHARGARAEEDAAREDRGAAGR